MSDEHIEGTPPEVENTQTENEGVVIEQEEPGEPGEPKIVPITAVHRERDRRKAAEREAQEAREQAAYFRGLAEKQAAPPTEPKIQELVAPIEPQASDYDDYHDYEVAITEFKKQDRRYLIELAKREISEDLANKAKNQSYSEKITKQQQTFTELLEEESKFDPDIKELVRTFHLPGENYIPLSDLMQDAIRESEVGPKLLRYFANNKKEVSRLTSLSQTAQLREIGRIEASILNKPIPAVKHVSQAPSPTKEMSSTGTVVVDIDKVPFKEYLERERQARTERRTRR